MAWRGQTSVRIIGGENNGRKIRIPPAAQLRPSGARVREALFSCLGAMLTGKHCLDLFAGSGALGLTAASRGAAPVIFVEKNRRTAAALAEQAALLTPDATVHAMPAARFLARRECAATRFDLVFLDPPFADYQTDADWARLLADLLPHVHSDARVYCEHNRHFAPPRHWQRHTARRSGAVYWQLLQPAA